jgi:hypothetical protein
MLLSHVQMCGHNSRAHAHLFLFHLSQRCWLCYYRSIQLRESRHQNCVAAIYLHFHCNQSKKFLSLIRPYLMTSAKPERYSRSGNVLKVSTSIKHTFRLMKCANHVFSLTGDLHPFFHQQKNLPAPVQRSRNLNKRYASLITRSSKTLSYLPHYTATQRHQCCRSAVLCRESTHQKQGSLVSRFLCFSPSGRTTA